MARKLKTLTSVIYGKSTKGFPLIIAGSGLVDWWSQDYLIAMYAARHSLASVNLYASHLVDFLSQLEVDCVHVSSVSDGYLDAYAASIECRGNTMGYVSQLIRTVLSYLDWLQREGKVIYLIGEGRNYQIQIKRTKSGIRHRLLRAQRAFNRRRSGVPELSSIEVVRRNGVKAEGLAQRFDLMIDWGVVCALRAKEICGLLVSELPKRDAVQKAIMNGRNVDVKLTVTKGSKPDLIKAHPLLVLKTLDWIEVERPLISERAKLAAILKGDVYVDPGQVFLSAKTGQAMDPRSLSNAVRKAFKTAVRAGELCESERVWLHGLRKFMINNELKRRDAAGQKNPEEILKHQTRHSSIGSMQVYIQDRYDGSVNSGQD